MKNPVQIFKEIPFSFDRKDFDTRARIDGSGEMEGEVQSFLDRTLPLVRPKALLREAFVEGRDGDTVQIDTVEFTSHALSANLEKIERVFPYIATCGHELDVHGSSADDFLESYWLDVLKTMALITAREFIRNRLKTVYRLEKFSSINPGSANSDMWPIEQQTRLFALFGDVKTLIGVTLKPSFLMLPNKTVSGIFFPSEVDYVNCQLCTREGCPNRKAPYTGHIV
jgi:hypothetical protein